MKPRIDSFSTPYDGVVQRKRKNLIKTIAYNKFNILIRTIITPTSQATLPHSGQIAATNPINWVKQSKRKPELL